MSMTYLVTYFFLCIGSFQVAFQSPSVVYVKENGPAEPLYCVASNHSLEHIYLWENLAGTISTSTPVMWSRSRPDTYKCTIRETEDGSECYSGEICVKLGEVHSCISFWAPFPVSVCVVPSEEEDDCKITKVEAVHTSVSHKQESFVQGILYDTELLIFIHFKRRCHYFLNTQLKEATNNFHNSHFVGKGGFGHVFRGRLRHSDVAMKVENNVCDIMKKQV